MSHSLVSAWEWVLRWLLEVTDASAPSPLVDGAQVGSPHYPEDRSVVWVDPYACGSRPLTGGARLSRVLHTRTPIPGSVEAIGLRMVELGEVESPSKTTAPTLSTSLVDLRVWLSTTSSGSTGFAQISVWRPSSRFGATPYPTLRRGRLSYISCRSSPEPEGPGFRA